MANNSKADSRKFNDPALKKPDMSNLWVVPYADFMTVLMIFFLMMFAYALNMKKDEHFIKIQEKIQESVGGKMNKEKIVKLLEEQKKEEESSKLTDLMKNPEFSKYVNITQDAEKVKIVFSNPILFDTGTADVKSTAALVLHEVAMILKQMDNDIIVEGHTDSVPISGGKFSSNWELSVARSMAVIRYLVHNEAINCKRFAAGGYGEYRPLYPNDSEENRAKNRRIEIVVMKSKKQKEAEPQAVQKTEG
ncbi:MAG: OmpA family protein [Elusimicrobiota bacterium]